MNLGPYHTSHTKSNSKWQLDLNVRPSVKLKTIKYLEDNIEENRMISDGAKIS